MDINPLELARQLTLIEVKLFNKLTIKEFLTVAWYRPSLHHIIPLENPNLLFLILTSHQNPP